METLKEVFLKKYPQYGKVLRVYEEVNEVECTFDSITKPRLYNFVQALNEGWPPIALKPIALCLNQFLTCTAICILFQKVLRLY